MDGPRDVLRQALDTQLKLVMERLPTDVNNKLVVLMETVRAIDAFWWRAPVDGEGSASFFRLGGCEALSLLVSDDFGVFDLGLPIRHSTKFTQAWVNSLIMKLGEIRSVEKLLEYDRDGLVGLTQTDRGDIHVAFSAAYLGMEFHEATDFDWLRNVIKGHQAPLGEELDSDFRRIRRQMASRVFVWRDHFIGYNTTPDIDVFYQKAGILYAQQLFGQDSFSGNAKFGGLEFTLYRAVTATLISWALKHSEFAWLLSKKHRHLRFPNLITIWSKEQEIATSIAQILGVTIAEAKQAVEVMSLRLDVADSRVGHPDLWPPLIRLRKGWYARSVAGCLSNPFDFLLRQLRFLYASDYDSLVKSREAIFRDELYRLFQDGRFVKADRNVNLGKGSRPKTDIDAVIVDTTAKKVGLFQLKWQDAFAGDMRERRSRKRNFLSKAEQWIATVHEWVGEFGLESILRPLGIKDSDAYTSLFFVIGRNSAHFSGDMRPDSRVAWSVWPQFLRVMAETGLGGSDPLTAFFHALQGDSPFSKPVPQLAGQELSLGRLRIMLQPEPRS